VENKSLNFFYVTSAVAFALDQISKFIIINLLEHGAISFDIFRYFSLTLVRNTGICFGMLSRCNLKYFIVGTSLVIATLILIYLLKQKEKTIKLQIAFGMIEGGILGNMTDRIRVNSVIDFINLHIWPVFNLADTFIVTGVCLILLEQIKEKDVPRISHNR